jgi:hypothetical protein
MTREELLEKTLREFMKKGGGKAVKGKNPYLTYPVVRKKHGDPEPKGPFTVPPVVRKKHGDPEPKGPFTVPLRKKS